MPVKRKRVVRKRKRVVRKPRRGGRKGGRLITHNFFPVGRKGLMWPDRLRTRCYWASTITYTIGFTAGVNDYIYTVFRANSIYDPDFTTGAGQNSCADYATLTQIYRQYRVLSSSIRVTPIPGAADSSITAKCRYILSPSSVHSHPSGGPEGLILQERSKEQYAVQQYTGRKGESIYMRNTIASIEKTDPLIIKTGELWSAYMGYNPERESYYLLGIQNMSSTTNFAGKFRVEMWFDTEIYDKYPASVSDTVPGAGNTGPTGAGLVQYTVVPDRVGTTGEQGAAWQTADPTHNKAIKEALAGS